MIKYGELTTKGDNRGTFIKLLAENIKNAISDYKINIKYYLIVFELFSINLIYYYKN